MARGHECGYLCCMFSYIIATFQQAIEYNESTRESVISILVGLLKGFATKVHLGPTSQFGEIVAETSYFSNRLYRCPIS
ncbi:hypothetical protein [Halococcus thailandensis]|uniref:Uncharacterized protein n=1 Tax=Halococcus thailandensis JCM 13552 TaxID=1227457 RepID=M0NJI6_9EURY|nr:hypothetical protein [Halococcus thailandensis]EMA56845.1 hypothetical protein C451_00535 [Halococcus thailandensis JCM 13552]